MTPYGAVVLCDAMATGFQVRGRMRGLVLVGSRSTIAINAKNFGRV